MKNNMKINIEKNVKMNKKRYSELLILLAAIVFFSALSLQVTAARMPEVSASILKYEPYPAAQGQVMKVWIKVTNLGTSAENVAVRFKPEYPFSLAPGEKETKEIGTIPGTEEAVVDFDIMVDLYAPNAKKDITFQYKWTSAGIWAELKEPILIETSDSLVVVSEVKTTPETVKPGDEVDIDLTVKNEGMSQIKTVDITLDTAELDFFSILGTGSTKRIDFLEPKESKKVNFRIMTDSNTEIKVYNIPLKIKYRDSKNRDYEVTSKVGLKVNAKPDLTMLIDNSEIFAKKTAGKVRAKIINKGIVNVKYITLKIVKTPDYDILSPSNIAYIGNLDNDDFDSAEFIIKPLTEKPVLKFILEFKDTYNKDYVQEYSLPLRIVSKSDLGEKKSKLPLIIILLLAAGGVFWYFRRKKRKTRK